MQVVLYLNTVSFHCVIKHQVFCGWTGWPFKRSNFSTYFLSFFHVFYLCSFEYTFMELFWTNFCTKCATGNRFDLKYLWYLCRTANKMTSNALKKKKKKSGNFDKHLQVQILVVFHESTHKSKCLTLNFCQKFIICLPSTPVNTVAWHSFFFFFFLV